MMLHIVHALQLGESPLYPFLASALLAADLGCLLAFDSGRW